MTNHEKPKNSSRQRWFVMLGVAISLIFLYLAFQKLNPTAFLESIAGLNPFWIAFGALWYFLAVLTITWRWQFLLRALGHVPLIPLSQIVSIGYMGNNVYPLRAGEALRIFLLKRNHQIPVTAAVTTVFVERVFDGIVMLSFLLLGLTLSNVQSELIQQVAAIATPIFVIAVIVFFSLAAFPKTLRSLFVRIAAFLPEAMAKILLSLSEEVLKGLGGLRNPLQLAGTVFASYLTWAIEASVYWIVMWAFGLDLPYPAALLVVGTVNLAGLIPASPGQVGVYEFFASSVMMALGVSENTALAFALVVHLVIWLPVTLAGFVFLLRYGFGWNAITHARELEEAAEASE
jgi:glycosyltransferase 2 family protein